MLHAQIKRALPICVPLLAILLSVIFSQLLVPQIAGTMHITTDPDRLYELAANISSGRGFVYDAPRGVIPALDRGPVYPYLLSAVFILAGGPSIVAAQVLNALLFGGTAFLVYLIGIEFLNRRAALLAGLVTAVHPFLLWYTARVWVETALMTILLLGILTLFRLVRGPSFGKACFAGLVLGTAILVKSILLPFVVVAGVLLLTHLGRRFLGKATVMVLVAFLVVLPWTLRNYAVTGMFLPVQTTLGFNMIVGDVLGEHWFEHPGSTSEIWTLAKQRADSILGGGTASLFDVEGDQVLVHASMEENRNHPAAFVRRLFLNASSFWYLSESSAKSVVVAILEFPLAVVLLVASTRLKRRHSGQVLLVVTVWYFVVVHTMVAGWARYSEPIVPLCILLAVALWKQNWRQTPRL